MGFIGVQPTSAPLTSSDITDGIISTAKIADDAVGNTKLNLASDYAFTGTVSGTDMQLLHTTTVSSNVGEVQIDGHFTSAFKNYKIIGSNIHTTADCNLNLKFMSGGSLLTGSLHRSNRIRTVESLSTVANQNESTDTEFAKAGGTVGSDTGEEANFEMIIYDPLATDNFKHFSSLSNSVNSGGSCEIGLMTGFYNSGQVALSGIEIDPSSGNIASGIFKLYGLR